MEWKETTGMSNSLQRMECQSGQVEILWSKLTNVQASAFRMNISIFLMYVSIELSSLSKYSVRKCSYPWIETLTPNIWSSKVSVLQNNPKCSQFIYPWSRLSGWFSSLSLVLTLFLIVLFIINCLLIKEAA